MGKVRTEEEVLMNEEIRDRFDRIDQHLDKQDEHHSEHVKKFNEHVLDDTDVHAVVRLHLEEHERNRKWRLALWAGVIVAILTTLTEFVLHLIKK